MALFGKRRRRSGAGSGSGYQDTYPWWMFWQSNQPDSAVGGQQAQDEGPTMAQPDGGQANPEGETVGEAVSDSGQGFGGWGDGDSGSDAGGGDSGGGNGGDSGGGNGGGGGD